MSIVDFFREPKPADTKQINAIVFDQYISDEITVPLTLIVNHKNILPRFVDGKPILLLEKVHCAKPRGHRRPKAKLPLRIAKHFGSAIKYLDALNNGYHSETPMTTALTKYREFVPQELPVEHKELTPQWLFSGIDWKPQAEEIKLPEVSDITQKISIGLVVGIIIFTLVILLMVIAIAVG